MPGSIRAVGCKVLHPTARIPIGLPISGTSKSEAGFSPANIPPQAPHQPKDQVHRDRAQLPHHDP